MKSNFISAVTHELKQPLALISGYAQTVYDYYDSLTYEEEMQCMRVVLERAQFLADLVEDLLDISMLEMGRIRLHREELDMVALARKVAGEYAVGEGQEIMVDFTSSFPLVIADARRMEQVLSNLLSNAVKFSNGEGNIIVSGRAKGDRVEVRVEDQGVGIDPSQLERIFERFYQADASTRRPYPGVGLGLFICRELVEAHGGRIWAENRPEGGSAFILEIPVEA
jgi:signal transduction histidine kinase